MKGLIILAVGIVVGGIVVAASNAIDRLYAIEGPATVHDGDSLHVAGQKIRLFGIDAPELDQTCTLPSGEIWHCGEEARDVLRHFIGDDVVTCKRVDVDRYKRIVATCVAHGDDLGGMMVRQGMALAYRHYSTQYVAHEALARSQQRGMWIGGFVPPWEYRQRLRQRAGR